MTHWQVVSGLKKLGYVVQKVGHPCCRGLCLLEHAFPVTDLRISHGLGPRAFGAPRTPSYDDSILTYETAQRRDFIMNFETSKNTNVQNQILLTAAQCSPVVNDLTITLFLKYIGLSLSRQIYSVFGVDLRLVVSKQIASIQSWLVEALDIS